MANQKGEIIDKAYQIIKSTFKEVGHLMTDIGEVLQEKEPTMSNYEEYSYGGKYLHLRANHTRVFKKAPRDGENENNKNQRYLAVICIFSEEDGLNRINLKNEPEIWIARIDITNSKEKTYRPWNFYYLLKEDCRTNFTDTGLKIGGDIAAYHQENDTGNGKKESWSGRFIGYPLTDITDKEFIKSNVIDKLFEQN